MIGSAVALPVASRRETARSLGRLARRHAGLVAVATLVLLAATGAALAIPWLLGSLVDTVTRQGTPGEVDRLVLGLIAATVTAGVLSGVGRSLVGRIGEAALADLREQVVDRALTVPLATIEQAGTGDLVARAVGDVDVVANATRTAIPEIIANALTIALTGIGLLALDWRLALAGALAIPIQVAAARWYLTRSAPIYAAEREADGARSAALAASVTGARTVRALRLQPRHLTRLAERSQASLDLAVQTGKVRAWFFHRLNRAEYVGLAAVLATGFVLVRSDAVTLGAATAAALYLHRLFDPVGALLFQLDAAQEAAAALARLFGVASLEPAPEGTGAMAPADASVELHEVRFGYHEGDEVLFGIDLELRAGERVALVGASGAGKSTIARLVAGIHAPTAGTVRLGGVPVAEYGPALARYVTLVTQEVHVFAGPVADDLRLARTDATDEELRAALETVGAWGWVAALPDGLATVVGAGGHALGPAEAQQLALARLVLANPLVAVLDEATAEAGSAGARRLEASARAALEGRTALVVAHRLSQAATADRIVVLDAGKVVEQGTHDELLAAGGLYAELWSAWSAAR